MRLILILNAYKDELREANHRTMCGEIKTNSPRGQCIIGRVGSCEIVFWQKKSERSRQEYHNFKKKQRLLVSVVFLAARIS